MQSSPGPSPSLILTGYIVHFHMENRWSADASWSFILVHDVNGDKDFLHDLSQTYWSSTVLSTISTAAVNEKSFVFKSTCCRVLRLTSSHTNKLCVAGTTVFHIRDHNDKVWEWQWEGSRSMEPWRPAYSHRIHVVETKSLIESTWQLSWYYITV